MSTVYGRDEHGNYTIEFDSRWRFPYLLGFTPEDPEYTSLQEAWEEATGKIIPDEEKPGNPKFRRRW